MRETYLNKSIDRTGVKVGDKIRITRDVVVKTVRQDALYSGVGKPRKSVTIVGTDTDTMALTEKEGVTLLERDKPSEIVIPLTATHIFWQDMDGYDYYARRDSVEAKWRRPGEHRYYTTAELIEEIEDGSEFDTYKEGSFQVLKHKYASGGFTGPVTLSPNSIGYLGDILRSNILPRNQVINQGIDGL